MCVTIVVLNIVLGRILQPLFDSLFTHQYVPPLKVHSIWFINMSANDISIKYLLLLAAIEIWKYVKVHPSKSTCACDLLEIIL